MSYIYLFSFLGNVIIDDEITPIERIIIIAFVCVYPFIVFDSIKIIISFIIVVILKNKLKSLIVKQ